MEDQPLGSKVLWVKVGKRLEALECVPSSPSPPPSLLLLLLLLLLLGSACVEMDELLSTIERRFTAGCCWEYRLIAKGGWRKQEEVTMGRN